MAQMPNYMGGLLGAGQTPFNPTLPQGLLARMAMPGQPAAGMAGNLMAMGQPAAPTPAPTPAPAAPVAPQPAASPTQLGLMSGGMAAMEAAGPGGSLGQALGAGLAAGSATFTAAKNEKADLEARRGRQEAFASAVSQLDLPAHVKTGVINLGPEAGGKLLADYKIPLPKYTTNVVETGGKKAVVATNEATGESTESYVGEKAPRVLNIADLSTDQKNAYALGLGRDSRDPETFMAPLSAEEQRVADLWLTADANRKANRTTINNNMPSPGAGAGLRAAYDGALGLAVAEFDKVKGVPARVKIYDDLIGQTESGKYLNGGLAETRLFASKIAQLMGVPLDVDKIDNTDTLIARLNGLAISRLKELEGRPTDKDMEILLKTVGTPNMSPRALRQALIDARGAAEVDANNWNRRRRIQNDQFKGRGLEELPAYLEEITVPPRPGSAKEETRNVTLPGGRVEKQVKFNGKWGTVMGGQFYPIKGQ
jgi:hypothetical protein